MASNPRLTIPSHTMASNPRLTTPSHSNNVSSTLHPLTTRGTSRMHYLPSWISQNLERPTGNESDEEDDERFVFLYS